MNIASDAHKTQSKMQTHCESQNHIKRLEILARKSQNVSFAFSTMLRNYVPVNTNKKSNLYSKNVDLFPQIYCASITAPGNSARGEGNYSKVRICRNAPAIPENPYILPAPLSTRNKIYNNWLMSIFVINFNVANKLNMPGSGCLSVMNRSLMLVFT